MFEVIGKWFNGLRKCNYAYANKERAVWHREGPKVTVRELSVEWYFLLKAKRLMLVLGVSDEHEDTYYLHIGIPMLFCLYINIAARPNRFTTWFCGKHKARETGFSFDKEFIQLLLHRCRDDWSVDQFNGWHYVNDWRSLFFGDCKHELISSKANVEYIDLPPTVNYPKGKLAYCVNIKTETFKYHYSRWYLFWFKSTGLFYTITPTDDIIVHGKRDDEKMYEVTIGNVDSKADATDVFIKRIDKAMGR